MKYLLRLMPLLGLLTLTGCAGMNSDFNCDKIGGHGAGCVSMNYVNKQVQNGNINANSDMDHPMSTMGNHDAEVKIEKSLGFYRKVPTAGQPTRTVDIVDRIWFAPFKDKQDNYHDSNFIYTVITHSHWNDYPVSAIQNSEVSHG